MASSLISTIRQAIFTETPSDVSIHQRSLVSMFIENSGESDAFSSDDFKIKSYRGKSMVLSRHLLHFLKVLVLGVIWSVYTVYNLIHRILTGKWRGMKSSSGINIVILTFVTIFGIVSLIYILMFLIRDVVLAPNNAYINPKGVISVTQPCYETQSFFLLNAATYWTPTDIHVTEGDQVYISASGSMYSDIGDVIDAASENQKLIYKRSGFGTVIPDSLDTADVQYCIYGRYKKDRTNNVYTDARFGSLLYQIAQPHGGPIDYNTDDKPNEVHQVNFYNKCRKSKIYNFKAEKSGTLYLTFNDILLDEATIDALIRDQPQGIWADIDTSIISKMGKKVSVQNIKDAIVKYIGDPQIWFQDNIGEILVNIRIEKNIWKSDMKWYKKIACSLYRYVDHCCNKPFMESPLPCTILIVVLYLGIDITVSNVIKRREPIFRNKFNKKSHVKKR